MTTEPNAEAAGGAVHDNRNCRMRCDDSCTGFCSHHLPCHCVCHEHKRPDLKTENERLRAENARLRVPIASAYACQRCGRRDGLDTSLADADWQRIRELSGAKSLLCLWCIDELAAAAELHLFAVLHFAGLAVVGGSWPTIYDDSTAGELAEQIVNAESRAVKAVAEKGRLRRLLDDLANHVCLSNTCLHIDAARTALAGEEVGT